MPGDDVTGRGVVKEVLQGLDRPTALALASAVLLLAGTGLAAGALLRRGPLDLLATAVCAAGTTAWLLNNAPYEGRTVLVVLPGNGVTMGDLLVLPAAALCGWFIVDDARRRWQRPRPGRRHGGPR